MNLDEIKQAFSDLELQDIIDAATERDESVLELIRSAVFADLVR